MREKTDELLEKYYKKFGDLHESAALLSPAMKKEAEEVLLDEFKNEYKLMHAQDRLEYEQKLYEYECKISELVPIPRRRFLLFFHRKANRSASVTEREVATDIEAYFKKREKALELLEKLIDESEDENPLAPTEEPKPNDDVVDAAKPKPKKARKSNKIKQEIGQIEGQIKIELPESEKKPDTTE